MIRMTSLLVAALPAVPALAGQPLPVEVRYVDCNAGDDVNDGLTPASPKRTIEAALPGADEVNVSGHCDVQGAALMLDGVVLRGPARIAGGWIAVGSLGASLYDLRVDDGVIAQGPLAAEGLEALWIGTAATSSIRDSLFFDTGSGLDGDDGLVLDGVTFASGDVTIGCARSCGPIRISRSAFYGTGVNLRLWSAKHMTVLANDVSVTDDLGVCVGGGGKVTIAADRIVTVVPCN